MVICRCDEATNRVLLQLNNVQSCSNKRLKPSTLTEKSTRGGEDVVCEDANTCSFGGRGGQF